MGNYSIGISGINAAQRALDIIGNNIANAATEGYHRQRINLAPAYSSQKDQIILGGGVQLASITRMIDYLLEQEILRQQSSLEFIGREFSTLRTVENAFGELSTGSGLSRTLDEFFIAMEELSAHPEDVIWQEGALSAAESLASRFRTLGDFLIGLENQIKLEADDCVTQINALVNQIAEFNGKIESIELTGGQSNNLCDQRDQCIGQLAALVGVRTINREHGVIDVIIGDIALVIGNFANELEISLTENEDIGFCIVGASTYKTTLEGGKLGGLLSLRNDIVSDIHGGLDDLACAIIQQINQYHCQGIGSAGSFTKLTGWAMQSGDLTDFDPSVVDGDIYIRVTDTVTGEVTRNKITVDASDDSLTDIMTYITAIDGLTASVSSSNILTITAETGYEFDFLPGVLSEPTTTGMTAPIPDMSVSGIYTGTTNQTYTCVVIDGGDVGNTDGLQIQITNGVGDVMTVNVGAGYAAGDPLHIGDGVYLSIGHGTLVVDESFEIEALASSDTTGLLAAVGINTFFSGNGALDMAVCSDIAASVDRIATARSTIEGDNSNAVMLAGISEQDLAGLSDMTPSEFYRRLAIDIGQQLAIKQLCLENAEVMIQSLVGQQTELSGVDVNHEAMQLLIFEQMFQAMAKYMNAIQASMETLMGLI